MVNVIEFAKDHPLAVLGATAGVGAVAIGGTAIAVARRSRSKRKAVRKKAKKRVCKRVCKRTKRRSKKRIRKTPHTAGKGKDRSTKRIRYTSKGQPYILNRKGQARFIKKSSAKRSHKLKGGRY